MKKIINDPANVVREMCNGIALAHPELALTGKYRVIRRKNLNRDKVSLITGGGSGHEPAHAGFVGRGMLDAAVCGDVFASPSQIQVYRGIRETAGNRGVLLIIKNYSGDIMNFLNAAHMAREDGIAVDYVKVDDDIAVNDSLYTVGRRGVAGTIFVHKIAGAAAEKGMELSEIKRVAEKAIANVKSIGFALTSCTVPAKGSPTFDLPGGEMEYGIGIHGEPGIRREPLTSARELAGRMIKSLCEELGLGKNGGACDRVAVLINGFGATPLMELYILNNEVARELSETGCVVARSFVGNYMTSIDMSGASVSILKLDDELEDLLNAPCDTPALKINGPVEYVPYMNYFGDQAKTGAALYAAETRATSAASATLTATAVPAALGVSAMSATSAATATAAAPTANASIENALTLNNIIYIIEVMGESIIRNEALFCEMDSHAGDGDFGASIAKGFRQLKAEWASVVSAPGLTIGGFLAECSLILMEHCGGASGPIWGTAFRAAGRRAGDKTALTVGDAADLLKAAVNGIRDIGERSFGRGAVVGDKTLIDALEPCAVAWAENAASGADFIKAFRDGAAAAVAGAKKTEGFAARMGRAGLVGERSLGYPDAGAYALGVIFSDIANAIK